MSLLDEFHGPNSGYILELYDKYLENPSSVDPKTRQIFDLWKPELNGSGLTDISKSTSINGKAAHSSIDIDKAVSVSNLAQAIRRHGHMESDINPLEDPPVGDPTLNPKMHGLTDKDLKSMPSSLVGWPIAEQTTNAYEGIQKLRKLYSSTIGYKLRPYLRSRRKKMVKRIYRDTGFQGTKLYD